MVPHPQRKVGWITTASTIVCMFAVPLWVYWSWICVAFHGGRVHLPADGSVPAVFRWLNDDLIEPALHNATPSVRAVLVYALWTLWQALLFVFAPGPTALGVPHGPDGTRLTYTFNGHCAFAATHLLALVLHCVGLFRLSELYHLFPQLLSVQLLWTCLLSGALYLRSTLSATTATTGHRETSGSRIYDCFMGRELNPHLVNGFFDLKWFYETRPGIMLWWFTTLGIAMHQYEQAGGTVSVPMALLVFFHFCFVNAVYKGEQCIPVTMDIVHEHFGWMLLMLDIVMVPCIFPLQTYYLALQGPEFAHPPWYTLVCTAAHCLGYWIFDTANSQKDYFRARGKHDAAAEEAAHSTLLPWGDLGPGARCLETASGKRLLVDGWWQYARHMNYLGDLMMCWSWGFICGTASYFPFTYATYLTPLLLHRERRDDRLCAAKYGADWLRYKALVPWRICPWIY